MKKETKIKYILYARKSTESEDRQVLSIESQIDELKRIADQEGLTIIDVLQESRSAKTLGRPIFAKMLERISKGEAQGILCWKLDRLARNFIDGGGIIQMLQTGVIQHIRVFDKSYYPQDNVLLMSLELGVANQYSRDLSVNVTRGMKKKAEMGWYPVQPPLGYLNSKIKSKGSNDIYKDPERYDLVRKMWDMMLTGAYRPHQIHEMATEQWGLRVRSGLKLSLSNVYHMFANPFYYGAFKWGGEWYQGAHEPMITMEEYDKVQVLLGRKGRPRPKTRTFAFTGTMSCAECGMAITAEEKIKTQKNGNVHRYTYYHCSKRSQMKCSQKSVKEKDIINQGLKRLNELEIPDEFHQWAMKWIEQENTKEARTRDATLFLQRKAYDDTVRKLDRYLEMRAREELTEEEYREKKDAALKEKVRLNDLLNDMDGRITSWADNMQSAFEFVTQAKDRFEKGPKNQQKAILLALGSNLVLSLQELFMDTEKTLLPMKSLAHEVQGIHERLEPVRNTMKQTDFEEIYSKNPIVCSR
ncbi:MAG: recombinase family protein [Minisyncoccia bacterium]